MIRTKKTIPYMQELAFSIKVIDERLKNVEETNSASYHQTLDLSIKGIDKRLKDIEEKLTVENKEIIIPATNQHEER